MTILAILLESLKAIGKYNSDSQVEPACVLWPDSERQWESILPLLKSKGISLFTLGDYAPDDLTGPAIWLRSVLAGKILGIELDKKTVPILYLPGVSKQALRDAATCPDDLKPMVELQYRGVFWNQQNGKGWTVFAFFKSDQGGLGLDVAGDEDTRTMLIKGLPQLLNEHLSDHKKKLLNKGYLSDLFAGDDPVKSLLNHLNQGEVYQKAVDEIQWQGIRETCKKKYGYDPENDGPLTGAEKLASQQGAWSHVWDRFREAPDKYSGLIDLLRLLPPPDDLFGDKRNWAQWNVNEEEALKLAFKGFKSIYEKKAISSILDLEKHHSIRRDSVWADLGEAPLAITLKAIAQLAKRVQDAPNPTTLKEFEQTYTDDGWRIDSLFIDILKSFESAEMRKLLTPVLQSIYLPWLERSSTALQACISSGDYSPKYLEMAPEGTCYLFVDGLRFDLAKQIEEALHKKGFTTSNSPQWGALPSITATAKPAVSPVREYFKGSEVNLDFQPDVISSGKSLKGGYEFKKALKNGGIEILSLENLGAGKGLGWFEVGHFDHDGHDMGVRMVNQIDSGINDVVELVSVLFMNGWQKIQIVTDHGWLLFPGGLPKVELPPAFTSNKWGRCAVIKEGAQSGEMLYPWYWNAVQSFALARGVGCYMKGKEYAHGGVSLQECLTLNIEISPGQGVDLKSKIQIDSVEWKNLRCFIRLSEYQPGVKVDIRFKPADNELITISAKVPGEDGALSLLIEDEDNIGKAAYVIVYDGNDQLLAQLKTKIGGE